MTTPSNSGIVEATARAPPGGHRTVHVGEDGTAWSTSNNHSSFAAELETQMPGLRKLLAGGALCSWAVQLILPLLKSSLPARLLEPLMPLPSAKT